ncbi:hypothetical protein KY348_07490 [Candidatus Woesearchaeota archaeon]|nr:hypothetical protein [Candidatus Woesearchaeota archaeon]
MKKAVLFVVLLLVFLSCFTSVLADGGFVIHDKDIWRMFDEEQQYCAINYKDGVQNMILTVDTAQELIGDKAVWIFPVPANPEEVDINIIKGFPEFLGSNLEDEAENSMSEAFLTMSATQIYPLPFFFVFFGVMSPSAFRASKGLLGEGTDEGVTVYESIEKMGLTTELISAVNEQAFTNYLVSKDLALPGEFKSILEEYIGHDYAFVVSWISDVWEFRNAQKSASGYPYYNRKTAGNTVGVFISFPTDNMYYPLIPTSVYGEKIVPAVIYVMDYVEPEIYDNIRSSAEIDYFFTYRFTAPKDLKPFFKGYETKSAKYYPRYDSGSSEGFEIADLKYTKIKISAPSNALTQDLWIKDEAPKKIIVYESIINRIFWWGLIIFIVLSCLASLIAGIIVFRKDSPSLLRFFFFGLFNLLTLIGVWVAAYFKEVDHKFTDKKQAVYQSLTLSRGKITAIAIPIIFFIILVLLIPLSILLDIESLLLPFILFPFGILLFPFLIFIPLILWGAYKHKKVLAFNLVFTGIFLGLLIISRIILAIII